MRAPPLLPPLVIGLALASACSDLPATDTPEVSAPPPVALRIPFDLYGVPGPWWRDNATEEDFQTDQKACRTRSQELRDLATSETRKDVGYRAFLECMSNLAWTRGLPPRDAPAPRRASRPTQDEVLGFRLAPQANAERSAS